MKVNPDPSAVFVDNEDKDEKSKLAKSSSLNLRV